MLLAAVALFFLFMLLKGKAGNLSRVAAKRQPSASDTDYQGRGPYSHSEQPAEGRGKRSGHQPTTKPWDSSFFAQRDSKADERKILPLDVDGLLTTNPLESPRNSASETSLADIADYDPFQHGYSLKKIDLFANKGDVPAGLLSTLKVLNRKDMPSDYFRWWEYELTYNEINTSYPDYYVWPYFTNKEAKTNFFLFLFRKYAADNKKWRPYEKDVSDCSQFSQRVYFLMQPGEVYMEDEQYFRFLFADERTREERKKLCNKIPNVFYVSLTPYLLKRSRSTPAPSGHAMLAFAPDGSLQDVILAEPQSGELESIEGDVGSILDTLEEPLTQYPLICQLGKILSIEKDKRHEANTTVSGRYFFPRLSSADLHYEEEDPRLDYGQKPVLLQDQTYYLFQIISSYLEGVLNYQSVDRIGFLHSLESMIRDGKLSLPHLESEANSSIDMVMHGLITLEAADLRHIKDEMEELKDLAGSQPSLSPEVNDLMTRLNYLFLLKLGPLLE